MMCDAFKLCTHFVIERTYCCEWKIVALSSVKSHWLESVIELIVWLLNAFWNCSVLVKMFEEMLDVGDCVVLSSKIQFDHSTLLIHVDKNKIFRHFSTQIYRFIVEELSAFGNFDNGFGQPNMLYTENENEGKIFCYVVLWMDYVPFCWIAYVPTTQQSFFSFVNIQM